MRLTETDIEKLNNLENILNSLKKFAPAMSKDVDAILSLTKIIKNYSDLENFDECENGKLSFPHALRAVKLGALVSRNGWSGKGMYIWLKPPVRMTEKKCTDPHTKDIIDDNEGFVDVLGSICMLTEDKKIIVGWTPSQSDMLSEDWRIL